MRYWQLSSWKRIVAGLAIWGLSMTLLPLSSASESPDGPVEALRLTERHFSTVGLAGGGDFIVFTVLEDDPFRRIQGRFAAVPGGPTFHLNPPGTQLRNAPLVVFDSDWVVFTVGDRPQEEETWSANLRTRERVKIADGPSNDIAIVDQSRSADGMWVANRRVDIDPSTLTIYPVQGGTGVEVGPSNATLRVSATQDPFTPDSEYVVYAKSGQDGQRYFSHRLRDGVRAALGPWSQKAEPQEASPDTPGTAIDQSAARPHSRSVSHSSSSVVMVLGSTLRSSAIDGSEKAVLARLGDNESVVSLRVSDTGTKVAFFVSNGRSMELRVADVGKANSSQTLVVGIEELVHPFVRFSPDGQWILYWSDGFRSVPSSGGTSVLIGTGSSASFLPKAPGILTATRRDGMLVPAVASPADGEAKTLVTNWPDGWDLTRLKPYPLGGYTIFSATDGRKSALYRVSLAGGPAERLDDPAIDHGFGGPYFTISSNGQVLWYEASGPTGTGSIYVVDIGYRCAGHLATLVGTHGADVLTGTHGNDVVVAGRGADEITTLRGADTICAGPGADRVYAGPGRDLLRGGKGRDRLFGQAGKDLLDGGRGIDRCRGGPGVDSARNCESIRTIP